MKQIKINANLLFNRKYLFKQINKVLNTQITNLDGLWDVLSDYDLDVVFTIKNRNKLENKFEGYGSKFLDVLEQLKIYNSKISINYFD